MFMTLLAVTFAIALATSAAVVRLFRVPIRSILDRVVSQRPQWSLASVPRLRRHRGGRLRWRSNLGTREVHHRSFQGDGDRRLEWGPVGSRGLPDPYWHDAKRGMVAPSFLYLGARRLCDPAVSSCVEEAGLRPNKALQLTGLRPTGIW